MRHHTRGALGFLIGLSVWWALTAPYHRFIGGLGESLVRATESPKVTRLSVSEGQLLIHRRDIRRRGSVATLPMAQLTANFILLVTLFAANRQPVATSNVIRFLIAAVVLFGIHVLAVAVNVIAVYAYHLGEWSRQHYTPGEQDFWSIAAHFYGMIGVFAIPIVLWWVLLPGQEPAAQVQPRPAKRRSA